MIIGVHSVLYSSNPDLDRAFLRDVLGLSVVDAGGGYLIFKLPPAEASVHESNKDSGQQELYFLCDNVEAFMAEMGQHNVECGPVQNAGWGLITQVTLPSGGKLHVYQPQHERPV
jgi:catechol 2,3-dioxygenase-like lactoylglutathione lyase family enzyme